MRMTRPFLIALAILLIANCAWAQKANTQQQQAQVRKEGSGSLSSVKGTISSISASNIVIQTDTGVKSCLINSWTKAKIGGQNASITDLKVGDSVVVNYKLLKNNVSLAMTIIVSNSKFTGEIVWIRDNVIVIRESTGLPQRVLPPTSSRAKGRKGVSKVQPPKSAALTTLGTVGVERRVLVTDKTLFQSHSYMGSIADLRPGYVISVQGTVGEQGITAASIEFKPAIIQGIVTVKDGSLITVKAARRLTLHLLASDKTSVLKKQKAGPGKNGTLADVMVGAHVSVGYQAKKLPSPLFWVEVFTLR